MFDVTVKLAAAAAGAVAALDGHADATARRAMNSVRLNMGTPFEAV
jgi:hypothetical protein